MDRLIDHTRRQLVGAGLGATLGTTGVATAVSAQAAAPRTTAATLAASRDARTSCLPRCGTSTNGSIMRRRSASATFSTCRARSAATPR